MIEGIQKIYSEKPTIEGAGVKLFRVFGNHELPHFDPFLLLDHFGSSNPDDYLKGFPWHPHRGIETVTYMLAGEVEHGDSLGNKGVITSGDIQWMTAGSGIIHQEMPKRYSGLMRGFQLWINLPKIKKMTSPRYCGILSSEIPSIKSKGMLVKVIAGKYTISSEKKKVIIGPVKELGVDVNYYDINLDSGNEYSFSTPKDYTTFIYVIDGSILIRDTKIISGYCVLCSEGSLINVKAEANVRFLHISGQKLHEPIAWGGPIVMNTDKELKTAFKELEDGNFIKNGRHVSPHEEFYQQ